MWRQITFNILYITENILIIAKISTKNQQRSQSLNYWCVDHVGVRGPAPLTTWSMASSLSFTVLPPFRLSSIVQWPAQLWLWAGGHPVVPPLHCLHRMPAMCRVGALMSAHLKTRVTELVQLNTQQRQLSHGYKIRLVQALLSSLLIVLIEFLWTINLKQLSQQKCQFPQ